MGAEALLYIAECLSYRQSECSSKGSALIYTELRTE